jgi:hypothetical protein
LPDDLLGAVKDGVWIQIVLTNPAVEHYDFSDRFACFMAAYVVAFDSTENDASTKILCIGRVEACWKIHSAGSALIGFRDSNRGNCSVHDFFSGRSSPSTNVDPVGYECTEKNGKKRDEGADDG